MCSVSDDILIEASNVPQNNLRDNFNVCNKCRIEVPNVVLRKKDAYCKQCFLNGTVHKFKALLGKSKLIRPHDKVLVCHKVGHPSTALLHFLRVGLDLNTPKKIRFEPIILFVEEFNNLKLEQKNDVIRKVASEIESFGFKPHFISFYKYINHNGNIDEIISTDVSKIGCSFISSKELEQNSLPNTERNDIKNIQLRKLLLDSAEYFECKFVFTPEISVDIAAQLLANVSLGRGSSIPPDTGFCDNRSEIKILRPLRTFDMEELSHYNKFNNLEPISVQLSELDRNSSIQGLLLKFVKDLQTEFPATITTVLKTGEKIASSLPDENCCRLCKGVIKSVPHPICSKESTLFSSLVSTETPDYSLSRQDRYNKILDKFQEISAKDELTCYACSKLMEHSQS